MVTEDESLRIIEQNLWDKVKVRPQRRLERRVRARLNTMRPADNGAQIAKLECEAANLVEAIASGVLRTSPAITSRLAQVEGTLARLKAHSAARSVGQLLPDLAKRFRRC